MEQAMVAAARAEADTEIAGSEGPSIILTASDTWHPGIVGLIAARLKEHTRRPAFAVHFHQTALAWAQDDQSPASTLESWFALPSIRAFSSRAAATRWLRGSPWSVNVSGAARLLRGEGP